MNKWASLIVVLFTTLLLFTCKKEKSKEQIIDEFYQELYEFRKEQLTKLEEILSNSIDYNYTASFGQKKLQRKDSTNQTLLSVRLKYDKNYFIFFPDAKSRKSFTEFLDLSLNKHKEWIRIAKENNVESVSKLILKDSTEYSMFDGTKFIDNSIVSSEMHFIKVNTNAYNTSMYVRFFGSDDDFKRDNEIVQIIFHLPEFNIREITKVLNEETITKFINKRQREKELFK